MLLCQQVVARCCLVRRNCLAFYGHLIRHHHHRQGFLFGEKSRNASTIVSTMRQRNLIEDYTSEEIEELLKRPTYQRYSNDVNGQHKGADENTTSLLSQVPASAYLGFDPTAPSLHVGNLVAIMALRFLQREFNLRPVLLVGSATAMIGDPSGRTTERPLLDKDTIIENAKQICASLHGLLDFECPKTGACFVNNLDWYSETNVVDFFRDTAIHFRMGTMLSKESVKSRLKEGEKGLSFTEFAYMTLQAEDFQRLYQSEGCVIQVGGSDQWGNITAGVELIRRKLRSEAAGITVPLLTTSTGEKLGKSVGNAVWLDSSLTSHLDFYQYWLRTQDADVERFLKIFTDLPLDSVDDIVETHLKHPEARYAQRKLAEIVTCLVRGEKGRDQAKLASRFIFEGQTIESCIEQMNSESETTIVPDVANIFAGCDTVKIQREKVLGESLVEIFTQTGAISSKKQFRRLWKAGGLYVNNKRVGTQQNTSFSHADTIEERFVLLRSGKKNTTVVELTD